MGFFSKLFKSEATDAEAAEAPPPARAENEKEKASVDAPTPAPNPATMIATPLVLMPYVPPAARPTPMDAFERATVVHAEPKEEDRPTLVAVVIPAVPAQEPRAPIAKTKVSAPPPLPPQARRAAAQKPPPAQPAAIETRAHDRGELAALVQELRVANVEFEAAAAAWTEEARQRKKDVLLGRAKTMLAIDQELARLGEIALVRELERLPFAQKLSRLGDFMREHPSARQKA